MKKHRDHIPFLAREVQILSASPIRLSYSQVLEAFSEEGLPEVDVACRIFSQSLEWPPMSDRVRFEVCLRLDCARWYCAELADTEAEDEDWSGSKFLEDLLVAFWREGGRRDWLLEKLGTRAFDRRETFGMGSSMFSMG